MGDFLFFAGVLRLLVSALFCGFYVRGLIAPRGFEMSGRFLLSLDRSSLLRRLGGVGCLGRLFVVCLGLIPRGWLPALFVPLSCLIDCSRG